jgi:hypothetical protein
MSQEQIDYWQRHGRDAEALPYLHELVKALDKAFISTWQSTADWQDQLDAAREWLKHREDQKGAA